MFLLQRFGGTLPGPDYFKAAVNYYQNKFKEVLFIAASDDNKFITEYFKNSSNTYIPKGNFILYWEMHVKLPNLIVNF